MRQRFFIIVVLLSPATLRASEVNVDSWSLSSLIHAHGVGFAGDGTGAVANPFHKVDHAALPSPGGATSTVDAEYSASWSGDNFIFLIEMTHAAAGNPLSLVTRSSANIWIVPEVDSTLRIDAEYNYALGPGIRTALMETTIFQENASTGEVFIYGYQEYAVTLGDPPVGQFTLDSPDIPLPAGSRYLLGYRLYLESNSGSASALSHADGFLRFEVVAEPHTLALLVFAAPLLLRKSRRT